MSGKRIVQLLAASLVLALITDANAAGKNRGRTADSSEEDAQTSQSKDDGKLVITGIDLPKGVTLTDGYITRVDGELFQPNPQQPQPQRVADGPAPDIIVQAVRVDADGNPITTEAAPSTDAVVVSGDVVLEESTTDSEVAEEESGGFFDFLFGPSEPTEEEKLAKEQAVKQAQLFADGVRYPDITPVTSNPRIGELVSVNHEQSIGVIWLDSRYLAFYGNELLLARNRAVEVTGVFQMTPMRDSKAAGLTLLHGNPARGDEIILPGPHYEQYINELYDTGQMMREPSNFESNK